MERVTKKKREYPLPPEPVFLGDLAAITEHPLFILLSGKKQLGLTYTIYPGATHTRYEHSLGTVGVLRRMLAGVEYVEGATPPTEEEVKALEAFAMLHDIGHLPFSHDAEPFLTEKHNPRGRRFLDILQKDGVFKKAGVKFELLVALYEKTHPLHAFVKDRTIGADRLDYLFRDTYHIWTQERPTTARLVNRIYWDGKKLLVDEGHMGEVERIQHLFQDNYRRFYFIKASTIRSRMLQRMIAGCLGVDFTEQELGEMNDADLEVMLKLSENPLVAKLAERTFRTWKHYKAVVSFRLEGHLGTERTRGKPFGLEAISTDSKEYFLDIPLSAYEQHEDAMGKLIGFDPGEVLISAQRDIKSLEELHDVPLYGPSGYAGTLFDALEGQQHRESLIRKVQRLFAVRLAVPPEKRKEAYGKKHILIQYMRENMFDMP